MISKRAVLAGFVGVVVSSFAQAAPPAALAQFIADRYDQHVTSFQSDIDTSLSGCRLGAAYVTGRDPVNRGQRTITLKQYRPAAPALESNRAVIIMPPTGGENVLDDKYANQLCSRGLRVVIVQSFEVLPDSNIDLGMYDRDALRSLIAIRQTVDFLTATGSHSIGILGTSLGALQASLATAVDSRISTATFIAGGLGLAAIIAKSNEPANAQLREIRLQKYNISQEQYEQSLNRAIHIDVAPFLDPSLAKTKKVLCVVAMNDTYVPTPTQFKLYDAFGRQGVITFEMDHVAAIEHAATFKSLAIINFFIQKMAP